MDGREKTSHPFKEAVAKKRPVFVPTERNPHASGRPRVVFYLFLTRVNDAAMGGVARGSRLGGWTP